MRKANSLIDRLVWLKDRHVEGDKMVCDIMLVSMTIIKMEGVQGVDPDLDRMLHFLGGRDG